MPKVLYKKFDAEGIKRTKDSLQSSPITEGLYYSRYQSDLKEQEEMLMRNYRCGYATLVKSLIAEKYEKEFGTLVKSFF